MRWAEVAGGFDYSKVMHGSANLPQLIPKRFPHSQNALKPQRNRVKFRCQGAYVNQAPPLMYETETFTGFPFRAARLLVRVRGDLTIYG